MIAVFKTKEETTLAFNQTATKAIGVPQGSMLGHLL